VRRTREREREREGMFGDVHTEQNKTKRGIMRCMKGGERVEWDSGKNERGERVFGPGSNGSVEFRGSCRRRRRRCLCFWLNSEES
jgi:hypothetical protein